jgi:class 3 adenylate cyclase
MRIIIAVGAVSAVALVLSLFSLWENNVEVMAVANNIDAVASTLALIALGSGLVYSFHKYGNQFLVGLTVLTILPFIMRQYYVANNGSPKSVMLNAIFLADSTMLIMLFIALAVAWGLSDTARLRPTGTPVNVDVVTMFFDLRGSTHWANDVMEKDFRYVGKFIDSLREWSWKHAANLPQCPLKLVKFLGDGFMFIWEIPNGAKADSANGVVGMAHTLCTTYLAWVKETISEPHGAPDGIGAGIDVGPAIRLTLENGSEDYLGSPLNIAAKMQNLARPNGGIVIPSKVWELLNEHLRAKFPKAGVVKLGQSEIPVHMTSDVEL